MSKFVILRIKWFRISAASASQTSHTLLFLDLRAIFNTLVSASYISTGFCGTWSVLECTEDCTLNCVKSLVHLWAPSQDTTPLPPWIQAVGRLKKPWLCILGSASLFVLLWAAFMSGGAVRMRASVSQCIWIWGHCQVLDLCYCSDI